MECFEQKKEFKIIKFRVDNIDYEVYVDWSDGKMLDLQVSSHEGSNDIIDIVLDLEKYYGFVRPNERKGV